ncbi:MAG TPA: HAD-IA family hydrolase [Candidatus Acidoferrum sp.]|nr:HAD-IA family hydrolase [Candidatus Acidoferrum sp.]
MSNPLNDGKIIGVRVVVFDLDGTLIDSKLDLALAVNATLEWMKRPAIEHERIYGYVGNGAPTLIQRALGEGASEDDCRRALEHFLGYYREHMLDNTAPYPGVREGLAALEHIPMAVLTNKPTRFSQRILEGLGLAQHFRYIHGGNSFERKKPDPMGMETLLRDMAAAPRETLMVGDSEVDVQTARNANTWVCGVTYGLGSDRLNGEFAPDVMVDSLVELPRLIGAAIR